MDFSLLKMQHILQSLQNQYGRTDQQNNRPSARYTLIYPTGYMKHRMFLLFSFLPLPCNFGFFLEHCSVTNEQMCKIFYFILLHITESNSACDPINERNFERQIVWRKNKKNPTKTLELTVVFRHFPLTSVQQIT